MLPGESAQLIRIGSKFGSADCLQWAGDGQRNVGQGKADGPGAEIDADQPFALGQLLRQSENIEDHGNVLSNALRRPRATLQQARKPGALQTALDFLDSRILAKSSF